MDSKAGIKRNSAKASTLQKLQWIELMGCTYQLLPQRLFRKLGRSCLLFPVGDVLASHHPKQKTR